VLLLVIIRYFASWRCDGTEWLIIHTKFNENRASGSKSERGGAMIDIAYTTS
jgi:hypothetical protein